MEEYILWIAMVINIASAVWNVITQYKYYKSYNNCMSFYNDLCRAKENVDKLKELYKKALEERTKN